MKGSKKNAAIVIASVCLLQVGCRSTQPQLSIFQCQVVSDRSSVHFEVDIGVWNHDPLAFGIDHITSNPAFMAPQFIRTDIYGRFQMTGHENLVYEVVIRSVEPRENRIGDRFKNVRLKNGTTNVFRVAKPVFD